MLGIQAGIKVYYRLKGSQVTVKEQQQQFQLGIGGTVRQTLLEGAQTLPHHALVPCTTKSNMVGDVTVETQAARDQETQKLTSLSP